MVALNGFDAEKVEPSKGFDAIPVGKYEAVIEKSEEKQSRAGDIYVALTFQIVDGEFKSRKLWHNLNLNHPKDTPQQIAMSELSAICRAVGVMTPKDTSELHDIPLVIKVTQTKDKSSGDMRNEIKGFYSLNSEEAKPEPKDESSPFSRRRPRR